MSDICDFLIVDAPFPPSVNALKSLVKIGKNYRIGKSKQYKEYQIDTFEPWIHRVLMKGKVDFGTEIMVWMVTCPPRSNCDLDNYYKCFLDCLEWAGVIEDDKHIVSLRNEKGPRVRGGLLRVFIANERHRDRLAAMYDEELVNQWVSRRQGPILDPLDQLRYHRVEAD